MIVDGILDAVTGALTTIVQALPADTIDYSQVTQYTSWAAGLGIFFPVGTLAAALGIIVSWELAIGGVRLGLWVYRHLPVVGAG